MLEAADMDACELRCLGLIAVDNRTEQVHVLMHVARKVGKAIQDHAPDSYREIVVANQNVLEVGIAGGGVNALVHPSIQPQGFDHGCRTGVERLDSTHNTPQSFPHRFRRHPGSPGGGKGFELGADFGNERKVGNLHSRRESPPSRIGNYQAIELQPLQGFTYRSPPDAEILGEVVVIEEIAGLDVKHQQPVPDALVGYVSQRLLCRIVSDCQNFKSHNVVPFSFKPRRLLTSPSDQYTLNATLIYQL